MPTPRKYFAACPLHPKHITQCRHCRGWAVTARRLGLPQAPRTRPRRAGPKPPAPIRRRSRASQRHATSIYRELHWPAPIFFKREFHESCESIPVGTRVFEGSTTVGKLPTDEGLSRVA